MWIVATLAVIYAIIVTLIYSAADEEVDRLQAEKKHWNERMVRLNKKYQKACANKNALV